VVDGQIQVPTNSIWVLLSAAAILHQVAGQHNPEFVQNRNRGTGFVSGTT
jgi:hypothetical protein